MSLVISKTQYLVEFHQLGKFHSNVPKERTFIHTLIHRSFSIWCDFKTFHFEIDHLKTILMKNNYPSNFTDWCIKSFLNKLYTPKVIVQNVPKRNVFVKFPFLGSTSFQIRKKLQNLFNGKLTSCNLKIVFTWMLKTEYITVCCDKNFAIVPVLPNEIQQVSAIQKDDATKFYNLLSYTKKYIPYIWTKWWSTRHS